MSGSTSCPGGAKPHLPGTVRVAERRPPGDDTTCLRPLGLCELGGCCDVCWYRPDHPRFRKS